MRNFFYFFIKKTFLHLIISRQKSNNYTASLNLSFKEWLRYFLLARRPNIIQSWSYGEAKANSEKWLIKRGIIYEESGTPLALVQILHKRYFFLLNIVRLNQGPIWLIDQPSALQIKKTFGIIKKMTGQFLFTIFFLAPNLENTSFSNEIMKELGFYKRKLIPWSSGLVNLTRPTEDLYLKLRTDWKKKLKASQKNNLTFVICKNKAEFEWFMGKHLELQTEKNFKGLPKTLLDALYQNSLELHEVWIAFALHENKKIAAYLVMRCGQLCMPLMSWLSDEGRQLKAGNFLLWNILLFMKNKGCFFFDHGGIYRQLQDPIASFKRGIPSEEYELIGEYINISCCLNWL